MAPSSIHGKANDNGNKLRSLLTRPLSKRDAKLVIQNFDRNAIIQVLLDSTSTSQNARESEESSADSKALRPIHGNKKRRRASSRKPRSSSDDAKVRRSNPMIGFGLPNAPGVITHRSLPDIARGPPYFYFENIAYAYKGAWEVFSRKLYGITPEFVDSKYVSATMRKRGYIHNLPIDNRIQILPPPKSTICEALPETKEWWPDWDKRTKLNCIVTSTGAAVPKIVRSIHRALEADNGEPSKHTIKYIMAQCRKNNLVWVGKNKAAALEPDEIESLLGFPVHHTQGFCRTNRCKILGNSFQVDTIAYHLSVLKALFPAGVNVLSVFSGIGGAEVALHRLKIPMKNVVSVEISKTNRNILRRFWEETNQQGVLTEFEDVQHLTNQKIEELMDHIGGFDLVIGGSPCDNLAGKNRKTRTGLEGEKSALFFEYCRILYKVREKAARMRRF